MGPAFGLCEEVLLGADTAARWIVVKVHELTPVAGTRTLSVTYWAALGPTWDLL